MFFYNFLLILGYPRLISGDYINLSDVKYKQGDVYYASKNVTNSPWEQTDTIQRYFLNFPFYPFRTLSPREMFLYQKQTSEFDTTASILPAHTQCNIVFKRRKLADYINYMLPENLDSLAGSSSDKLTVEERNTALTFSEQITKAPTVAAPEGSTVTVQHMIKSVTIKLVDCYLQVNCF